MTYMHQIYTGQTGKTKNIWNLVTCTEAGIETDTVKDLYCLRAGLGFTNGDITESNKKVVNYDVSYEIMEQYQKLINDFSTLQSDISIFKSENKQDFDAVMWILDHMLLSSATEEEYQNYLKTHAGYSAKDLTKADDKQNVLTRSDIEAITQLAIWYFTNKDEDDYHQENLPSIYMNLKGDELYEKEGYKTYGDIFNGTGPNNNESYGQERQNAAAKLYTYLITNAKTETQGGNYKPERKITIHTVGTKRATEQPIVQVEEKEPTIEVQVTKTWEDEDNKDGKRDKYKIKIEGTAGGKVVYQKEVELQATDLTYTFTELPQYSNGEEIKYTVTESGIPKDYNADIQGDYKTGFEITNRHTPETTSVTVTKIWNDKENQDGKRAEYEVTIKGVVDGETIVEETQKLDKDTTSYTWDELPKYHNGKLIEYTVTESIVPNEYTEQVEGNQDDGFRITNTYIPEEVSVTVAKTWNDSNNQDGKRASYKVKIVGTANGIQVYEDEVTLDKDTLTHTWNHLPKYNNAQLVTYTVIESGVPDGYTALVEGNQTNGFTITNSYTPDKVNVRVDKVWQDNNDRAGLRDSYKVKIIGTANGIQVYEDEVTLDKNTLTYTWTNLPKYNNGQLITYTVEESEVPSGYIAKVEGNQQEGYRITNINNAQVDVALRKFITAVNGEKLEGEKSRVPEVDTNKLNTTVGDLYQTTAEYNHTKRPLQVKVGDIVTYTIRLYNEGEVDTYIKEVTDYLPAYLQYVAYGDDNGTWWNIDEATKRKAETTRQLYS